MYGKSSGIVSEIPEAKILDASELSLPAVGAALVIAERGNAARGEGSG